LFVFNKRVFFYLLLCTALTACGGAKEPLSEPTAATAINALSVGELENQVRLNQSTSQYEPVNAWVATFSYADNVEYWNNHLAIESATLKEFQQGTLVFDKYVQDFGKICDGIQEMYVMTKDDAGNGFRAGTLNYYIRLTQRGADFFNVQVRRIFYSPGQFVQTGDINNVIAYKLNGSELEIRYHDNNGYYTGTSIYKNVSRTGTNPDSFKAFLDVNGDGIDEAYEYVRTPQP